MAEPIPVMRLPVKASRQHGPGRKLLAWLGGAVLVLVAAFWCFYVDAASSEDDDLMVRDPVVPKEQNGIIQLRKMDGKLMDFPAFAKSRGLEDEAVAQAWHNDALVNNFLTQAQPALAELDRILALPHFAYDEDLGPETKLPELTVIINLERTLDASARQHQLARDYASAVKDVLRARQLAKRLGESHGIGIGFLTNVFLARTSAKAQLRLLDDPALPSRERDALADAVATPIPWKEAFQGSVDGEYQLFANEFKYLKEHNYRATGDLPVGPGAENPWIRFTLMENTTRRQCAPYFRAVRDAANGPYATIDFNKITAQAYPAQKGLKAPTLPWPNALGRYLAATMQPDPRSLLKITYVAAVEENFLQTACALRHYHDDHHALPVKLEDLAPQYISAVPRDPFDGKPLRYNSEKGLVYSVGTSLNDSGGSKYLDKSVRNPEGIEPLTDSEQPTLQLEFQKTGATAPPLGE